VKKVILKGINGDNPLGFLAAMGILRLLCAKSDGVRLGFLPDGSFHPFVTGFEGDLADLVWRDAAALTDGKPAWFVEYEKHEKKGTRMVADLKAPPDIFARFLCSCVAQWLTGEGEAATYAAAFGTSVALDGKGNTKPTAFHFTAANQQFLGTVGEIRASITSDWVARSLFEGKTLRHGSNLRFDPAAERNWALMANNPNDDGTSVDAPLEWLAFRGLPLFPTFPRGTRIITTAVSGRGDDMQMTWPLWSVPISIQTVRSALQIRWNGTSRERTARGIFAVCTAAIRRTSQGFGNFGPAAVAS
jgi:hypothetical protein